MLMSILYRHPALSCSVHYLQNFPDEARQMTNGMAWNAGRLKTQRNVDGFIRKRIYRKLIILLSNMNRKTGILKYIQTKLRFYDV